MFDEALKKAGVIEELSYIVFRMKQRNDDEKKNCF